MSKMNFILAAFKAGKISNNPFAQPPPGMGGPRPGMPGIYLIIIYLK
jgi:hypothetical protein